ncbi:HigA family addiction module antitoxin [Turicimonas muris]|uniref:HigA family addiction module antitoxin n=2 Tax=Turicimonas muris TaxID=1796652 RepID=UPI00248B98EC|nr:HigA family addiction module antitoxin [Turicimonas muris]
MTAMFNPPHPGKIVAEQLEYLNVSIREFSRNIGVAPSSVSRIIKGKSPISAAMAVRFSSALPSPTHETWLAMQSEYDAWQARQIVNTSLIKKYEPLNQHA